MTKEFPGPYAGLSSPTRDDAIYATKSCVGPHGSGQLNYINPGSNNRDAINAAYQPGGDPHLPPDYVPPASLKASCDAWNIWWAEQHPQDHDKKHKGNPDKKHQ